MLDAKHLCIGVLHGKGGEPLKINFPSNSFILFASYNMNMFIKRQAFGFSIMETRNFDLNFPQPSSNLNLGDGNV
jgi:hypothetical protein